MEQYKGPINLDLASIDSIEVLYLYNSVLKKLLWQIKYQQKSELVNYLDNNFLKKQLPDCDLVIPVPIHPLRHQQRGFNQVSLIFEKWLSYQGAELREDIVYRARSTEKLATKNREERRLEVQNSFRIYRDKYSLLQDKRILLLDDILTTGFTVSAIGNELKIAGAARVQVLALARGLISAENGSLDKKFAINS